METALSCNLMRTAVSRRSRPSECAVRCRRTIHLDHLEPTLRESHGTRRDETLHRELRVLLFAPDNGDVALADLLAAEAAIACHTCHALPELRQELDAGAAAVLLAEEHLRPDVTDTLATAFEQQPPWSDLTILILTSNGDRPSALAGRLELLGNVMFLERPIRVATLASALRAVLRGRVRQYELRAHLAEREATAQALRQSEERLRHALSAAEMGTWRIDPRTNLQTRDESFNRILGLTPSETTQPLADFLERVHPEDRAQVSEQFERAICNGASYHIECRIVRPDGNLRWLRDRGAMVADCDGRPVFITGTAVDVSELKRTEEQLKALNETLEQRVAERTAVAEQQARQLRRLAAELTQAEQHERRRLAKILHDHLQQLLVAARLSIGLARGRTRDDGLREALAQVDDLLNQSVDASRSLTVSLSPPILYDGGLAAALDWLARWMEEKHGLHVEVRNETQLEPGSEDTLVFLFESVRELLFNVVKHAQVSDAVVTVRQAEGNRLCVEVYDDGEGFRQPDVGADVGSEGFGLFSIRERLEILGGQFEIETAPGEGVTVRLYAPAKPARRIAQDAVAVESGEEREQASAELPHDRIRVVLVDDHRILRMGMVGMLQGEKDLEIVGEASDGQMAIEMAREMRPDVIIMDITMPRMSGIEATRRILAEMPHIQIIGMSMHEQEGMTQAMLNAGAVDYLTKGGSPEELCRAIRSACCHA